MPEISAPKFSNQETVFPNLLNPGYVWTSGGCLQMLILSSGNSGLLSQGDHVHAHVLVWNSFHLKKLHQTGDYSFLSCTLHFAKLIPKSFWTHLIVIYFNAALVFSVLTHLSYMCFKYTLQQSKPKQNSTQLQMF